jgi:opacity protein-like surface antigen
MNKKVFIIVLISGMLFGSLVYAQDFAPVGTSVAQFLEISVGARGTGLAGAYTAITNDAEAAFWNPAGLANIDKRDLFTSYTKWPADISIGGASFAMNFEKIGVVAVSATYLMTDDMEITTISQPEGTGETFGITNFAVGLSFARYMTDHLSVGVTGKLVREKYLTNGYTSWALDIGTQYRTDFRGLTLGMSILHFGPETKFSGEFIDYSDPKSVDVNKQKTFETYSLPINFRFGIVFDVLNKDNNKIIAAVDMIHPNNNLEQYNCGVEYCFKKMFFLRGGYKINADEGGLGLGTGIRYKIMDNTNLSVDYSFADLGVLKAIHRVALGVSF